MECPVKIHKLTDESPDQKEKGKCPVDHSKIEELENIGDEPTLQEYKKLKQVMSTITRFYKDGSNLKQNQVKLVDEQLLLLDLDLKLCVKQLEVLEASKRFMIHPRGKEYKENLIEDRGNLEGKRKKYMEQKEEFESLFEWSKTIVKVCEWLEANLDHFCKQNNLLPEGHKLKEEIILTEDEIKEYTKGLNEITYNLQESQDFFEASVDGRLKIYHELELEIIDAQVKVVDDYPIECDRKAYWLQEFKEDREYVEGNMKDDDSTMARREKMLVMHRKYLQVLQYHKDKLRKQYPDLQVEEVEYDPKYNIF